VEFDNSLTLPLLTSMGSRYISEYLWLLLMFFVERGIDFTSGRRITVWIEDRDAMKMIRV